ncbi:unnamed protein product [Trifolium pratense]|uniref:Uncharacterized protein n=1 Tax=Trifolium pratense TaxID=57577 RepID=A0ACB0JJ41_TRIPR|nr:unnamed protein product [Trifolium pratense]
MSKWIKKTLDQMEEKPKRSWTNKPSPHALGMCQAHVVHTTTHGVGHACGTRHTHKTWRRPCALWHPPQALHTWRPPCALWHPPRSVSFLLSRARFTRLYPQLLLRFRRSSDFGGSSYDMHVSYNGTTDSKEIFVSHKDYK